MKKKVFISYAHEDLAAAHRLYNELKAYPEVEPWLDKECLLPGQNWRKTIRDEIKCSSYFVAVLSTNSTTKRGYVQSEIRLALDVLNEIPEGAIYLLPVRIDECKISHEKLHEIQYVDLFPSWDEGLTKILKSLDIPGTPKLNTTEALSKTLWSSLTGSSKRTSIYLGTLYNQDFARSMVSDWDMRTASTLIMFLSSTQFLGTVEPPFYQPDMVRAKTENFDLSPYIEYVKKAIENKNAVIIGPADVNPATEVVLGAIYGVQVSSLFRPGSLDLPDSTIKYKAFRKQPWPEVDQLRTSSRFFYRTNISDTDVEYRGFLGKWIPDGKVGDFYYSLNEVPPMEGFSFLAHLLISRNPFSNSNSVVVLNGVSGPATFALSLILTAGAFQGSVRQVHYLEEQETNPDSEEHISHSLTPVLREIVQSVQHCTQNFTFFRGVQMIIRVNVTGLNRQGLSNVFQDAREISNCEIVPHTLKFIMNE